MNTTTFKVLYFASIREAIGVASEDVELPATVQATNIAALVDVLRTKGDAYATSLSVNKRWRVAVNQEIAALDTAIVASDEIAFFPPVTGG